MSVKERLKELSKEYKKTRLLLMTVSVLIGFTIVLQTYFIVAVVDAVFLGGSGPGDVIWLLGGAAAALLLRAALQYVNNRTGEWLAAEVKQRFRRQLLATFKKQPLQQAGSQQTGRKVSTLLDAVDEIDAYFSSYYVVMMQSSLVPLILLGAIFYMNWVSGLILLVTAPFIPLVMIMIGRSTQAKSDEQLEKLQAFSGKFLDVLQGLGTLRLFGRARQQEQEVEASSLGYRDATMTVLKVAFLSSLMLEFISMLSISLVALEVGLRLVIYDQLSFFTAFFVLILAPEFFASLKEMGSAFHTGRGSMAAAERVYAELDGETEPERTGAAVLEKAPELSFEAISYTYEDGRFQLGPVSETLAAGSSTAVIGKSGSGKTTLMQAASGLLEADGQIKANGLEQGSYSEAGWFQKTAYVTQHPYMFAGTLRENIALGMADAPESDLTAAVEQSGLAALIEELPNGLETVIGDGGRGLSGGEKQRVALARAFMKKPHLLFFDEPTSGLDVRTEQVLQQALEELGRTATVVTIAHRLHTIRRADKILVMEQGRVVESGTHEALLESSVRYRQMLNRQEVEI
ncbi:thiol reductant ABC exporter subunit CydD [Alkalicoccus luteus]|uniref:Thiol reductant ABC exporter subunit CydD n=1 Tax=Alkalicoccus luteus TaxID=1237094 RepID=A0A969PPP1_9BACI|nr:thiol reductant ABC exporter subunit CydD [Alkalicoccus luteus]NJP38082.1 thiol reductant ABC exporter subunit CydD [Alkalicoccus luteus]